MAAMGAAFGGSGGSGDNGGGGGGDNIDEEMVMSTFRDLLRSNDPGAVAIHGEFRRSGDRDVPGGHDGPRGGAQAAAAAAAASAATTNVGGNGAQ